MKRYWAFRDMHFEYEGYNIPEIYKALWNFVSDKGYALTEYKYAHGLTPDSPTQGCVGVWIGTTEVEKKYALAGVTLRWTFHWGMAPKPGANGEKPPLVSKGSVKVDMSGFLITDYLGFWGGPLLKPLFQLRDRYFYRKRRVVLLDKIRQDAKGIFKDLQEFTSFLPQIK